ncbi:universal stress protein [Leptolyngbya sp. AN03gr2]|uniref:universal stress protein n=1 Tax=unclassified Leptolyngbya TaxID=2650499 RepID=UPI003D3201FE
MFHKILVAIDHSDSTPIIFSQALALAKTNQAELMIFHALAPFDEVYPSDPYVGIPQSITQSYLKRWQEREQAGIEKLRSLKEQADKAGISTEFSQNIGDPGKVICTLAKTWNADLIVIGRRGLSGFREFWLGSVSNYVLHHAPCHVLTIQGIAQTQEQPATVGSVS